MSDSDKDDEYKQLGDFSEIDKDIVIKEISEIKRDLQPSDPSMGLILSQGHYTIHLAFFIVIQYYVNLIDRDSFYCYN